jgi:hypothetical protein
VDQVIKFQFQGAAGGLVAEVKRLNEELRKTKAASQDAGKGSDNAPAIASTKSLGGGVAELAGKYFLVLQALQAVMAVGKGVYGSLIQQNVELQQQLTSTQAALVSTNKVISGGVEITDPTAAIKALEGPVNDAIARIREGSLELVGVTSAELVPVFQNIAGQIGQLGGGLNDAADLTLKFAAALGTFNIPLAQQRQEVSSILQGNITMDSVLAKNLNITNDQVRQWKAQGTAVAELNKRLEASAVANKLNSQTIGGYASNIQEIFENITLAAGKDLTAEITADLGQFYNFLVENKDEIQKFVTEGADLLLSLIQTFKEAGFEIGENLGPELVQIGEIAGKLGPIFTTVAFGLEKLLILASDNPQFQAFLTLTNAAATAVQAIGSLNGEYAAGTEAAEIYGQRSSAVAQEAVDALGKIKKGDTDATKAKTEAIAKINDQLTALKESNVVGAENRAVIKLQITELETYKGKLENSGGALKLVSKDTTQLTSDLKLLTEQFDAQGKAAELATAQLTAAAKRSRVSDAPTSAREEQNTLYQIEQEGLNERLRLAQEKADGIAAIKAKGGDVEQQKEFTKQLTSAQVEQANLEGQIAEKQLARRRAIQGLQLKDLEISQSRAADAIAASETELLTQVEQDYQADLTQKQRYELLKLGAAQERVQAEIETEKDRAAALSALKFDDPDEREANEAKIRVSKQKTASLSLKALENQRQIEQGIAEFQIKKLNDRAAADKRNADERVRQLGVERNSVERITQSIERQTKLRAAQNDLARSQTNLLQTTASIQTAGLDRALELRKKLNDATTSPEVRKVLQQQLQALTGRRDISEVAILQRKAVIEDAIAKIKAAAQLKEQEAARNALRVEAQRNELAAKRAVIEARIAEINSKTALAEAKKTLTGLQKTPGADPKEIADAQQSVKDAQSNADEAGGVVKGAKADLDAQKALAPLVERNLAAQQAATLAQEQSAEFARRQAQQLSLVEAKGTAIAAGEEGVRFTPADFAKINAPNLGPLTANFNAAAAGTPAQEGAQSRQLNELIDVTRRQAIAQETLNTQLLRIANRPGNIVTVNNNETKRPSVLAGTGL